MGWMACCMTVCTRRPTHNPRYPHVPKPVLPASYSIPARCHPHVPKPVLPASYSIPARCPEAPIVVRTAAMKSPLALLAQEQACGFPLQ